MLVFNSEKLSSFHREDKGLEFFPHLLCLLSLAEAKLASRQAHYHLDSLIKRARLFSYNGNIISIVREGEEMTVFRL